MLFKTVILCFGQIHKRSIILVHLFHGLVILKILKDTSEPYLKSFKANLFFYAPTMTGSAGPDYFKVICKFIPLQVTKRAYWIIIISFLINSQSTIVFVFELMDKFKLILEAGHVKVHYW